jgi:hypothetical protein
MHPNLEAISGKFPYLMSKILSIIRFSVQPLVVLVQDLADLADPHKICVPIHDDLELVVQLLNVKVIMFHDK